MIEEKLKEAFKSAGLGNGSIFWNNILTICQEAITDAKEEGFNAGCDFTCKKYGDSKTESEIKIEECKYWRDIIFSPEQQAIKPTISLTDFQLRIVELSPKENA